MAGSIVPALIDALVTQCTAALPGVRVSDGYGITDDPGDYLLVGADDPDNLSNAASASQEPGPFGTGRPRDETGTVNFIAQSWNGSADMKAARNAAYSIANAVADICRSNPSLGVTGLLWTGYGPSTDLAQLQDEHGAIATLSFSISFRARV